MLLQSVLPPISDQIAVGSVAHQRKSRFASRDFVVTNKYFFYYKTFSLLCGLTLTSIHDTGKTIALTIQNLLAK